jgi:hypothetical protein
LPEDDGLTVIAISTVAYFFQDVFHAGGHAVAAWLSGAHRITICARSILAPVPALKEVEQHTNMNQHGLHEGIDYGSIHWLPQISNAIAKLTQLIKRSS